MDKIKSQRSGMKNRSRISQTRQPSRGSPAGTAASRQAAATPSSGRAYHAPALEKGLDILEYLATESVPVSQADLARALGRTPSEIFRMLVLLERRGYVSKDAPSARYSLSLRLYAMAHAHNPF